MGELEVRGPWVARAYFGGEGEDRFTADGWFKTGDVVTIDAEGYMRITDRSKDVIKSGGEWIQLGGARERAHGPPGGARGRGVRRARTRSGTSARSPRWCSRRARAPPRTSCASTSSRKFAKFWLPDDFVVLQQIPRTSTGKFLKSKLREQYGELLMAPEAVVP